MIYEFIIYRHKYNYKLIIRYKFFKNFKKIKKI